MYLSERALNMELLEHLKYTGCVIKETLRINPPVPGGFRVALKTFELNVRIFRDSFHMRDNGDYY